MNTWILRAVALFLLCGSALHALSWSWNDGPHVFELGPEAYRLARKRVGGSSQDGTLYGLHFRYRHIRPWGIYLGLDGYAATGRIRGTTSGGSPLRSQFTDRDIQAQLGYQLQLPSDGCTTFTPLFSYGLLYSRNKFLAPSPLPLQFRNSFNYVGMGFLADHRWKYGFGMGVHYQTKWMIEGRSKVSDDPIFDDMTLIMNNRVQYELELPLFWKMQWSRYCLDLRITPFYRHRHYGGRENFPFDFIDTRFTIYGSNVYFILNF